jgi:hypothetical protein
MSSKQIQRRFEEGKAGWAQRVKGRVNAQYSSCCVVENLGGAAKILQLAQPVAQLVPTREIWAHQLAQSTPSSACGRSQPPSQAGIEPGRHPIVRIDET